MEGGKHSTEPTIPIHSEGIIEHKHINNTLGEGATHTSEPLPALSLQVLHIAPSVGIQGV